MPPEIAALMERGTPSSTGRPRICWASVLEDLLHDRAQPLYRGGKPDLVSAPLPTYPDSYFDGSFVTEMGTFDTGRGCPFACSFCSIINVQGRKSRYRAPAEIVAKVRGDPPAGGGGAFFFTGRQLRPQPSLGKSSLDGLIELRARRPDAQLHGGGRPRLPQDPALPGEAGRRRVRQIFMGVESMNPDNLADARKNQNKVSQYRLLWDRCHELGILVHAGYIVGFPTTRRSP